MGISKTDAQEYQQWVTAYIAFTAAVTSKTLLPYERICRCDTNTIAGTVVLPAVGKAKGKHYVVKDVGTYAGTNNITVKDAEGNTVETLSTNNDEGVYWSDGEEWHIFN